MQKGTLRMPHACHGICTLLPLHAALTIRFVKTRNTTHLKCCACHAKWRWTQPKCSAWHENCNSSSANDAKVLHLPQKTTFNAFADTWECQEMPHLPRKTNHNLLWRHRQGKLLQLPRQTRRRQKKTRASRRDMLEPQNEHIVRDFLQFSNFRFKIVVFRRVFSWTSNLIYLKIDVSCEASVNSHHISQNATPATEFAPCHHFTQPWHGD